MGLVVLTATRAAAEPAPGRPETARLSPDEQRELDLMLSVLDDEQIDLARRRSAAVTLLARNWPAAVEALARRLREAATPSTRRAIAGAVAEVHAPPAALVAPLLQLVGAGTEPLRRDVADALSRYENAGVVEALIDVAGDADAKLTQRRGAIAALAEHRKSQVVQALLSLTGPPHERAIRSAAFTALADLTGNTALGEDREAWQRWWAEYRDLPRDRWLARLVRSLSQANKRLTAEQAQLTERLVKTFNRLYVAAAETERPALVLSMLDDPVVGVRLLAASLIERKVLNAQPVDERVRERLREAMTDEAAAVRAAVAALLRDMDDEPAADVATRRLLAEPEPIVQNAYLSLLARKPREAAVDPGLLLLERGATRAAAAQFLAAAHGADRLTAAQANRAHQSVLRAIDPDDANTPIEPEMVHLLGTLRPEQDAGVLAGLLDHPDESVRLAAAEVFVQGQLPMAALLAHANDPALHPPLFEAVARHGQTLDHATTLLHMASRPTDAVLRQAWRGAIVAVAGRLDTDDLLTLDREAAAKSSDLTELRLGVLQHAMPAPDDASSKSQLLSRLAELAADAGRGALLAEALQQLDVLAANEPAIRDVRLAQLRLRADLLADPNAAELAAAREAVTADPNFAAELVPWLIDAAEASAATDAVMARRLVERARQLAGNGVPADLARRMTELEQRLGQAEGQG